MPIARKLDADVARRFLVARHQLAPPRRLVSGPDGVLHAMQRLGSFQFDPLAVAGRNHDLLLHARVDAYRPVWTEELLYGRRRAFFEAYNKGLSLLPVAEIPWYRITWDRARARHERETFPAHAELVARLLARIRDEGPLSSLDFERGERIDWYWGPTNRTRATLEALAESGIIGLARRDGNRRVYDLMERLFPAELLERRVSVAEQLRHKLLSRYRAHGLLGATGQAEVFIGTGSAAGDPEAPDVPSRRALHSALVEHGDLVPVEVEGVRGLRNVVASDLPLLDAAERGETSGDAAAVTFLAPLDPFVWDRNLLQALFGFHYVWEVYVPEHKRRWGYYVLPILFGGRLVGRIEPRIERAAHTIRVLGVWWEAGFDPRRADGFVPAMRDALLAYRRFAGARRVEWAPAVAGWGRVFGTGVRGGRTTATAPASPTSGPAAAGAATSAAPG